MVIVACASCGRKFSRPTQGGRTPRFCSDECRPGKRADTPCSGCGKLLFSTPGSSLPPGQIMCRPCRRLRRLKPCGRCGRTFDGFTTYCGRECWEAMKAERRADRPRRRRKPSKKAKPDSRLGGNSRTKLNAQVRARTDEPVCPLCGYLIDRLLPRVGSPHPLSSVIDEWLPRSRGGAVDLENCVEVHRLCNAIKHNHWPVTVELQERCEARVRSVLVDSLAVR